MGGRSVHHRPGAVKFEKRAVAFIDILGFKALVEEAAICVEASGRLSRLVKVLETAVPALNCKVKKDAAYLIPDHIYISDCIILSAPLEDESRKDYSGLDAVVMRVIQLSHVFLDAGYIIRGGVAIGDVWHFKNNIVGPAYQEALDIEKTWRRPLGWFCPKELLNAGAIGTGWVIAECA